MFSHMLSVRSIQYHAKRYNFQVRIVITTGLIVGFSRGITDDTCNLLIKELCILSFFFAVATT